MLRLGVVFLCVLTVLGVGAAPTGEGVEWQQPPSSNNEPAIEETPVPPCEGGDDLCQSLEQPGFNEPCTIPELCDDTLEEEKRSNSFSSWGGKRVPFTSWGGKRVPFTSWGGKRVPFTSWGGKRVPFTSWGGKRVPFTSWGGKRVPFTSWGGKRVPFSNWGGKRSVEEIKKNTFNSWGGKRVPFSSWGGKRGGDAVFSSWGGKRSVDEEEARNKRAASGKRTPLRSKLDKVLADAETNAVRRNTVDFFPWGGKRSD